MQDILACCCGLDIHKESVVACLMKGPIEEGAKPQSEIREFGTLLKDLILLRQWLEDNDCHTIAMESTGIYWQPVYALLEKGCSDETHLLVVNARHMKNVPGKKTDMRDAEWIASLLRAGLLKGSFIPKQEIRNLRQFTRYRKALIRDITSQKNRIEKFMQSNGFRLSSFLSDIFGSSGMALMQQLIQAGSIAPEMLSACLKGRARQKTAEIAACLNGTLSMAQGKLLKMQLEHLEDLKENLQEIETEIQATYTEFETAIDLLDSIPGIDQTAAFSILAEIGQDMTAFPTAQHICAWAGLVPGNHESAGKKKKQPVLQGNNYLKTMLCEVAWVIASHKKLYLSTWYWRLKHRTDAKRAIVALARKLLVIIYTMLKTNRIYDDQKFIERKEAADQKRVKRMVNELANMGFTVTAPA